MSQTQKQIDEIINGILDRNNVKFPSFFAQYGRIPIAGQDYDPDIAWCQDDYEYYEGTGRYSNDVPVITPKTEVKK